MNDKEWISVDDRLPDAREEVWVYGRLIGDLEKRVTIGTCWQAPKDDKYVPGHVGWNDVYGEEDGLRCDGIHDVTHWMQMDVPEPPQQE